MPREEKPAAKKAPVVPTMPVVEPVVETPKPVAEPGKYKLMAFYMVYGKYFIFQVGNPKNVVAVALEDVEFTVGEQDISADVLSKESSKPVFVPDSVANTLDAVRTFVLP